MQSCGSSCALLRCTFRSVGRWLWENLVRRNFPLFITVDTDLSLVMYGALVGGWGVPAIGLAIALVYSGVSFRFGSTCHINHNNSLADFWIPLLIFAGITVIIQFSTFGYCIKVYLASLADSSTTTNSSGLPSYTNSIITVTPRQAYRRVQRVVSLQWRGIAIVLIIITDVIFFSIVFVLLDNDQSSVAEDPTQSQAWLVCLMANPTNKNECLEESSKMVLGIATVSAVLILLSVSTLCLSKVMIAQLILPDQWNLAPFAHVSLVHVRRLASTLQVAIQGQRRRIYQRRCFQSLQ